MSVSTAQPQVPPGVVPPTGAASPIPRVNVRRRRSPAMVSLGVVLVIIGALAGWRYVASSSTATHSYIAVYRAVPQGTVITADDLQSVSISSARGLTPIPVSESSRVIGEYAKVPLVPGTLLTDDELTTTNAVGEGQAMVGLLLGPDQRPTRPLKAGDLVLLILVPPPNGAAGPETSIMPNLAATVVEVSSPDTNNNAVVDVLIPEGNAATIAANTKLDRISVVLVAGS